MNYLSSTMQRALILFLGITLGACFAVAQDDSGSGTPGAAPAATAPAEQNSENPPLSGLDQPTAEPAFGGRSYIVPGFQLSESADSNAASISSTKTHTSEITRALASADMQKIWRQYQFGLDYIAAGDFYSGPQIASGQGRATQSHTLAAVYRVLWRTGQLAVRDSFDYLPEGSFGFSSYGGAAAVGSSLGGGVSGSGAGTGLGGGLGGSLPGGLGNTSYGSIAYQPRIDNTAVVDIVQGLSPRSTFTLAGGYGLAHYLNVPSSATSTQGLPIIDSQQLQGQVGYNHLLSRRDQVGFQYAFQDIHFPRAGSGSLNAHVWNALYGHRITGKLNFTVAGGPQLVIVHNSPATAAKTGQATTRAISANSTVSLAYTVSARTSVQMSYQRYVSPGSGFYAGANTDAARVSLAHRVGRHWTTSLDSGYSHNSNLQISNTTGAGVHSRTYQFWYAGASLQRQLGQHFSAFMSYQFNDLGLGACTTTNTVCSSATSRHTGMIGINWHPRPIRLD